MDHHPAITKPWQIPAVLMGVLAVCAAIAGGAWWILAVVLGIGALIACMLIPSDEKHAANTAADAIAADVAHSGGNRAPVEGSPNLYTVQWGEYGSREFKTGDEALQFASKMAGTVDVELRIFQHYQWAGIGLLPVRAQRWNPDEGVWMTEWPTVEAETTVQRAGAIATMQIRKKEAAAAAAASSIHSSSTTGSSFDN